MNELAQLSTQVQEQNALLEKMAKKLETIAVPEYMDEKQVCEYTTLSQSTIKKYQHEIGFFSRDRRKIFRKSDVDAFIQQNTIKRI